MEMKNVKAMTLGGASVKKIEDSNGDIIWGSLNNYPYRKLEYLDIPDQCYINLNDPGLLSTAVKLDVNFNATGATMSTSATNPFGAIYYSGSRYYRYHLIADTTLRAAYDSNGFTTLIPSGSMSQMGQRNVIELNFNTYGDQRVYFNSVDKGTFAPNSGTSAGPLFIGGRYFNNRGTVQYNNYPYTIRVYSIESRTSANDLNKFYPVQRKSDGKVGLLKVYNDGASVAFYTSVTATEPTAGPVELEYYDGAS